MARRSALLLAVLLLSVPLSAVAQTGRQERVQRELGYAESLERAGQYSRALIALEGLLLELPAEPGAVLAYERITRRQGRLENVLPVLERAIRTDPESPLLRQVQLRVLAGLGRTDEVREAGERWLQMSPRSDVAYREYAAALQRVGELREAESILRQGQGAVSRTVALTFQLADLYASERRWFNAAGQWLALLRLSPGVNWDLIGRKLEALGLEAVFAAEAILEQLPDEPISPDERKLAAIAAIFAGRPEEARERAEALLDDLEPRERELFATRFARTAAAEGQPALVAWAYRRILLEVAADSVGWDLGRRIVQYDLSAGDTAAALKTLDQLQERAELGTPAHRWAGGAQIGLFAARGASRRAERSLRRYAELYPDDPQLPSFALAVAESNIRRGRLDEAVEILKLVPEAGTSSSVTARLAASRAYLALYAGRYDEARAEFEVAAATLGGEERGAALRFLGFVRNGSEAELRAVAAAQRALMEGRRLQAFDRLMDGLGNAPPSSARPAILLWAGELAVEEGATDRAEAVLRRIPELYPSSGEAPVALVTLAEALAESGRPTSAIELLETLILEYPESALTPLGRRRLAEFKQEIPRS